MGASKVDDQREVLVVRETLEIGALHSIRTENIPAFEAYYAQLKSFYYSSAFPESPRMYMILGLHLIHLLSANRIADFHVELEAISVEQLTTSIYIKHPVQAEQSLMEGSYNKVWNTRLNVPAMEYKFFMDILMGTIR